MANLPNAPAPRSWHRIAIAFSGGGFRATLFHLGTIAALRSAGLLANANFITSVSGGSILAAHLVQNWERYNGSNDDFSECAAELIDFARRDVRGRILRRWILSWLVTPCRLSRRTLLSRLLQAEYSALYRDGRLKDLNPALGGRPELHILCTSLTTGELCSFDFRGFRYQDSRASTEYVVKNPDLPISLAVAASSAFPPLFPPLWVTREELNAPDLQFSHALSDGGVFDNLGLQRINELLAKSGQTFDTAVVSDAEGAWGWKTDRSFSLLVGRNIRASDLLMKRVSALEYRLLGVYSRPARFDIGAELDSFTEGSPVLGEDVQRQVPRIRTDLDVFSHDEVNALLRHGYAVARATLKSDGVWSEPGEQLWSNLNPSSSLTATYIRRRSARGWISRATSLLSFRDWTSYAIQFLITVYLSIFLLPYVLAIRSQQAANAQKDVAVAQSQKLNDKNQTLESLTNSLKSKVVPTQDALKDFNKADRVINPDNAERGTAIARVSVRERSALPSGTTVLYDGFRNYSLSSFDFQTRLIVPWGTRKADLGVANPSGDKGNAQFFLNSDTAPYIPQEKDRQGITAKAGIVKVEARDLGEVHEAPQEGYLPNYYSVQEGQVYCVRTWDGGHFAKIRINAVTNDQISFDWVFQPSGSRSFK